LSLIADRTFGSVGCIDSLCFDTFESISASVDVPIWLVSHDDVDKIRFSKPYGLWILGNEQHRSFDFKFSIDSNCKFIIKPYPYIENYSPVKQPYVIESNLSTVLSCQYVKPSIEDPRVLNLPLGCSKNFRYRPLEKSIDIGFYGQISGIRSYMLPWIENLNVVCYKGFGINRSGEEYSEFISKCKIAFCPSGQSPETYRLFEAAKSGCAIISNCLPNVEYYRECPALIIPWECFNESNSDMINKNIYHMLDNIDAHQQEMKLWIEKWTSPDFISNKVIMHAKRCL
jgi:hypothetical protein